MEKDLTQLSERIIGEARRVADDNRTGGRHRREGTGAAAELAGKAFARSIGSNTVRMKVKHWAWKLVRAFGSVFVVLIGALIAGFAMGGMGVPGVMATALVMLSAFTLFMIFPRMKTPKRADLTRTSDARQLVTRTEMWLEHQRPALPAPAISLVNDLGTQLDALGKQLAHVDPAHPAAVETRKLVGEYLPETIESYTRIPVHLRREERAGGTPDKQLVDSLGKISREIDHVTRQLAEGSLDDLAIRNRYLEYKYGNEAVEDTSGKSEQRR